VVQAALEFYTALRGRGCAWTLRGNWVDHVDLILDRRVWFRLQNCNVVENWKTVVRSSWQIEGRVEQDPAQQHVLHP
jgi:hypothetical protein